MAKLKHKFATMPINPLFSYRINHLIATGKVKVYYSLTEFKNRLK